MSQLQSYPPTEPAHADRAPSTLEALAFKANTSLLLPWSLRQEFRRLGQWLEAVGFTPALQAGLEQVILEFDDPRAPAVLRGRSLAGQAVSEPTPRTARLLERLGIRRLRMDPHLESNQVSDVLKMLWMGRRRLARRRREDPPRGFARRLAEPQGVQFACTNTRVDGEELVIEYSYCVTRFSRLVQWFERQHHRLSDHRALFNAAPKVGLLAGMILSAPYVIYLVVDDRWVLLAVTLAGAAAVFAAVYTFFMVVGSVEYDNEVKAMRLTGAYRQLQRYAARVQEDMERARMVQQRMLPTSGEMPRSGSLQWASSFEPEAAVGGDYYDAARLDERRVAILFADVSGHGMAAAFVTAILKTAFQRWVDEPCDLGAFVRRLNHNLCRLIPEDSFAAAFAAIFDVDTGRLEYINGGHHPEPWALRAGGAEVEDLDDARAMLLGVDPDLEIVTGERTLAPGDTFLAVTDGVIEAMNLQGLRFGQQRLAGLLAEGARLSVDELVERITGSVRAFVGEAEQSDDRTVLAFRVR